MSRPGYSLLPMRRSFVLLFMVWTFVQLAFAGLPMKAVQPMATAQHELSAATGQASANGTEVAQISNANHVVGCDAAQSCELCGTCHAGHQNVMPDGLSRSVIAFRNHQGYSRLVAGFASADNLPSFKPPIG